MAPHTVVFRAVAFSAICDMAYGATAALTIFKIYKTKQVHSEKVIIKDQKPLRAMRYAKRSFPQLELLINAQTDENRIRRFHVNCLTTK